MQLNVAFFGPNCIAGRSAMQAGNVADALDFLKRKGTFQQVNAQAVELTSESQLLNGKLIYWYAESDDLEDPNSICNLVQVSPENKDLTDLYVMVSGKTDLEITLKVERWIRMKPDMIQVPMAFNLLNNDGSSPIVDGIASIKKVLRTIEQAKIFFYVQAKVTEAFGFIQNSELTIHAYTHEPIALKSITGSGTMTIKDGSVSFTSVSQQEQMKKEFGEEHQNSTSKKEFDRQQLIRYLAEGHNTEEENESTDNDIEYVVPDAFANAVIASQKQKTITRDYQIRSDGRTAELVPGAIHVSTTSDQTELSDEQMKELANNIARNWKDTSRSFIRREQVDMIEPKPRLSFNLDGTYTDVPNADSIFSFTPNRVIPMTDVLMIDVVQKGTANESLTSLLEGITAASSVLEFDLCNSEGWHITKYAKGPSQIHRNVRDMMFSAYVLDLAESEYPGNVVRMSRPSLDSLQIALAVDEDLKWNGGRLTWKRVGDKVSVRIERI